MHTILAQASAVGPNTYFSLVKIITVLVLFVGWTATCQWVDRDTERVKTRREMWNLVVLGGGLGGLIILIVFPWTGASFFLGLAFWVVLAGGTLIAYVVHRNGRVMTASRVMTITHFKRLMAGMKGDPSAKADKGIRVKMIDSGGNAISKPQDVTEFDQFNVVQDLLFDFLWKRATDADVLVGPEETRMVYKIDGVISEQNNGITREEAEKALTFLKRSAGLNVEERRRPQTGTVAVALLGTAGKPESLDVMTSGSTKGERLRLRLHRTAGLLRVEDLGFTEQTLAKFNKLVSLDSGLVLFAGPKESGITTTQYATLRAHDAYLQNIYTLETERLHNLDNITQQVHGAAQAEVSYARMLQTILRREPDVVMIDQCEDRETAQLACRAAGDKKIYLAIRGANCFDGLARLMALLEDPKAVSKALVGVVAQRLVRVLCPACREAYKPDPQLLRKANLPADRIEHFHRPPSEPILDKKGREIICQTCQNSRYVGRTGVFEVLMVSDQLKALIASGAPMKQIKGQARSDKMRYLQEEGLLKVIDGATSMAEIMRGLRMEGA